MLTTGTYIIIIMKASWNLVAISQVNDDHRKQAWKPLFQDITKDITTYNFYCKFKYAINQSKNIRPYNMQDIVLSGLQFSSRVRIPLWEWSKQSFTKFLSLFEVTNDFRKSSLKTWLILFIALKTL